MMLVGPLRVDVATVWGMCGSLRGFWSDRCVGPLIILFFYLSLTLGVIGPTPDPWGLAGTMPN